MDSFIWIRNDLCDATIPRLTVEMILTLQDAELLRYLYQNSGGDYEDFENFELPRLREMTVQVYNGRKLSSGLESKLEIFQRNDEDADVKELLFDLDQANKNQVLD